MRRIRNRDDDDGDEGECAEDDEDCDEGRLSSDDAAAVAVLED